MSRIFGRTYRLVIGKSGQRGVEITGLRISFRVEKFDGSTPNVGEIKVWNLSQTTRALAREPDTLVQLYAGYQDVTPLIFLGAVTRVSVEDDGVDSVTTITSGKQTTQALPIAQSFKGQQKLGGLLTKVAERYAPEGVDLSAIQDIPASGPRGITLSGEPTDVLNKLTRANNLDWFIEDGIVKVVPRGASTQDTAFILSPSSGLEGSPRALKPSASVGGSRLSVEATARLNGELRTRRLVQIAGTTDHAGWYLIRRVLHEGDLWGTGAKSWSTTIEATPIEEVA